MYPSFQINGERNDIADECKDKLYRPETNPSVTLLALPTEQTHIMGTGYYIQSGNNCEA